MLAESITCSSDSSSYVKELLETPERPELLRLTALAGYVFHAPVAYLAIVDHTSRVATRIGSGSEYWHLLKKSDRLAEAMDGPLVIRDTWLELPAGANFGDLRFVATAPLVSSSGVAVALLVIGDRDPRPNFLDVDTRALADLACAFAGKMELRMIASHARETELALHEAERRFRAIADSSAVPMICSGADGASSFVNKAWLEFTGRSMEDELADGGSAVVHPESRKIVYGTYWRAFQARKPVTVEFPMRRHDGEYRWMLCRGVPRSRVDGTFAGFVGTLADVTNHYQAVAEVQKHALCASAVANAAGVYYAMLDPHGKIERASPILQSTANHAPSTQGGDFLWNTALGVRCGADAIREAVHRARDSKAVVRFRTSAGDGVEDRELYWTITPILTALGDTIALVATAGESARPLQKVTGLGANLDSTGRQTQTRDRTCGS